MTDPVEDLKQQAETWFRSLRDQICTAFEAIEEVYAGEAHQDMAPGRFQQSPWLRTKLDEADGAEGGGGVRPGARGA